MEFMKRISIFVALNFIKVNLILNFVLVLLGAKASEREVVADMETIFFSETEADLDLRDVLSVENILVVLTLDDLKNKEDRTSEK